ncbi:MAG: protein kinase [bacterium]
MAEQRYTIVQKIDSGGMAEVWMGKASSLRGFEKLVAIKRVLPSLSRNKKFISMFLDEARLSLYLNHANVVQTFDIGMAENAYFIVMEWVDGTNLKGLMSVASELGFRIPPEQAVFITMEVCKGLSHAHNRKDPKGRPLAIVHRDVSPPNVLLSREGEVKLVDFGLAKAASQITSTDPGIVKGKFSYLSPEAAHGQTVDGRADVFAAGIVLWEMLAGRKLFDGATDLKTVELVRKTEIPPLARINPDVEPALEAIVRRALARDPRERFQTAEQLGHELARYLFQGRMLVTSYDIATLVKRVLAYMDANAAERSKAVSLESTVQEEIERFTSLENLEELDRMEFKSVLDQPGGDDSGLVGIGIDPRGWADELGEEAHGSTVEESVDDTIVAGIHDFLDEEDLGPPVARGPAPAAARSPAPATPPVRVIEITGPPSKVPASAGAPTPTPPAEVARPTGPHPAAGKRSIPLSVGVVVGLLGAGALGVAIWLLAS